MIILLILVIAALFLLQAPGLWREKMHRELAAVIFYLLLALVWSVPYLQHWWTPNPMAAIEALFAPLAKLLE